MSCNSKCSMIGLDALFLYTPLTSANPVAELKGSIVNAQNQYVQKKLRGCWEDLCDAINEVNGDVSQLGDFHKTLLKKMEPAIAWYAYGYWCEFYGNLRTTPKGLTKLTDTDMETADMSEAPKHWRAAESQGDLYMEGVIKYLKEAKDKCYDCVPVEDEVDYDACHDCADDDNFDMPSVV